MTKKLEIVTDANHAKKLVKEHLTFRFTSWKTEILQEIRCKAEACLSSLTIIGKLSPEQEEYLLQKGFTIKTDKDMIPFTVISW